MRRDTVAEYDSSCPLISFTSASTLSGRLMVRRAMASSRMQAAGMKLLIIPSWCDTRSAHPGEQTVEGQLGVVDRSLGDAAPLRGGQVRARQDQRHVREGLGE